jgi:NADH-quinone oxidoreductase subunit G
MKPRPNEAVNHYYLCDYGRLNYRWLNRQDRVALPQVRQRGRLVSAEWEVAIAAAAALLSGRRAYVLASPMLSNEALFLLSALVKRTGGAGGFTVEHGPAVPLPGVEDLALRSERAANVRGAELMGFARTGAQLDGLGRGDVLVVADEELLGVSPRLAAEAASRAGAVIVLGTVVPAWASAAEVVLPIANAAEDEGTFTNVRGRVQRFLQAKAAPGLARPSWFVLSDLLAELGERSNYFLASEVFAALAAAHPEFAGLSYDALGLRGATVASARQAEPAAGVA